MTAASAASWPRRRITDSRSAPASSSATRIRPLLLRPDRRSHREFRRVNRHRRALLPLHDGEARFHAAAVVVELDAPARVIARWAAVDLAQRLRHRLAVGLLGV